MFRRRNLYVKRLKLLNPNPSKSLTRRQRRWIKRKNRLFSVLTKKSYARRVLVRATMSPSDFDSGPVWRRGRPMVYAMPAWKYQRQKWYWKNPSAVPGLLKIHKLKFLALHRRYTMGLLNRWLHFRARSTWVRWLQQVQWHQWAWIQRLEHLPHLLLTKTGWFNHPKEAMAGLKGSQVQLNGFPKGALQMKTYATQPGDIWSFVSMPQYHRHLSHQSHFWAAQWSHPMTHS
jgi:hypothetical protein